LNTAIATFGQFRSEAKDDLELLDLASRVSTHRLRAFGLNLFVGLLGAFHGVKLTRESWPSTIRSALPIAERQLEPA
jgi:hypothetical protein